MAKRPGALGNLVTHLTGRRRTAARVKETGMLVVDDLHAGYDASEVLGQGFARFTYPEDLAYAQTVFQQVLAGKAIPLELRVWNKSGAAVWVRIAASQFFSQGQLAGVVGFITDISGMKQAEQALRESEARHLIQTLLSILRLVQFANDTLHRF